MKIHQATAEELWIANQAELRRILETVVRDSGLPMENIDALLGVSRLLSDLQRESFLRGVVVGRGQ